jgi:uncharacterized protein
MPTLEQARQWYPANDPVHGFEHVLRVYRMAERLARAEGADLELVRAAVLLHDAQDSQAGEDEEHTEKRGNHHLRSAEFAAKVLGAEGWPEERIAAVQHCIQAHRFRDDSTAPQTLEAQVLFDADKLDAIGAIGVVRALAFAISAGKPVYYPVSPGFLKSGELEAGEAHSAYHEYLFKLVKLKDRLYTPSARSMAEQRHARMVEFFEGLSAEMKS